MALKASPGFSVYIDNLNAMKQGILNSFGRIKGTTIEEVGMKCSILQAQLGLIESILNFTIKGYDELPELSSEATQDS